MFLRRSPLRDAIGCALASGAIAAAGIGTSHAQETSAPDKEQALDRVEVTGTRIRQVDVETAAPVLTISRAEIEKQGFQSVSDILQNISAMGSPPLSRAQPLSSGESAGGTFVSLRNLGAERTLILLNGRRLGVNTSGLADTSMIPAVAIERIEVLKDGASAIYGSDAIAGVVNIITRNNYEGISTSAYFGQYSQGDGDTRVGSLSLGLSNDKSALFVGAEWAKEDGVMASERPFSAFPRSSIHPTNSWTVVHQGGGYVRGGVRVVLRPGGDPRNPADFVPQNRITGTCANATPTTGCTPGSTLDKSNTNEQMHLRTPQERRGLYVGGSYDFNDNLRFRTEFMYSNRFAKNQVAGYPVTGAAFDAPLSADSYFNPTPGTEIDSWWRRTWEVPRVSTSDLTTYRFTGVFEGSFEIGDHLFDWDAGYFHNTNKLQRTTYGNATLSNMRAALGPSFLNAQGRVQCGTAAAPIPFSQCVPWNPLLPEGRVGQGGLTNNPELVNYLFQRENSTGETSTTVLFANLSGDIVDLPAGPLTFALGVENRKERGKFVPGALAVAGNSTELSASPTRGDYSVNEVYAELQIPILADLPFAKELRVDVASRHSDYDTFGKTTNNKIGLKWKPFDSLLLRATAADGFRAPTISDLYGGGSQTFASFTDPCDTLFGDSSQASSAARRNCVNGVGGNGALGALGNTYRQLGQGFVPVGSPNSQTPVPFVSGSNPDLQPESSKTQTIGAAWNPSFVEGLYMSLDWWKIRIDDTIVGDDPSQILTDCYVQGIASRCSPRLFTRDPALGYVNFMHYGSRNAGYRKVEGFDFDLSYVRKTERWGNFRLASNTTYTVKDYLVSSDDPSVPLSSVGFRGDFRIRSNFNLGWEKGRWGASWNTRYYSSMKENCTFFVPNSTSSNLECNEIRYAPTGAYVGNTTEVESAIARRSKHGANTFHDIQVRWEAPWDATISIGANNVFGHLGPVMYSNPNSNFAYYGGFDIGRFWYMKYTQKF